jgi:hypothetical protein
MATTTASPSTATTSATPPRDRRLWTLQHAREAAAVSYPGRQGVDAQRAAESVLAYVRAEHYQNGGAWMGAGYPIDGSGLSATSLSRIDRMLTPVPEAFACVERRVDGGCGNQADIDILPNEPAGAADKDGVKGLSPAQEAFRKTWKAEVSAAWDRMQLWGGKDLRKPTGVRGMVAQASWTDTGSACLRFFFNPASRTLTVNITDDTGKVTGTTQTIPKTGDRAAALAHIRVVAPPPDQCFVYVDPDTHEKTGVFLFSDTSGTSSAELWFADGDKTRFRLVTEGTAVEEETFPWGGLLPIVQANVGCIFTDAVRRLQGALDTAATSMLKNLLAHGYSQRTEVGAEEDGYWATTPPAGVAIPRERDNNGTTEYFNPVSPDLGPEVIRQLRGYAYDTGANAEGPTQSITTPGATYHDPSSAESLIQGVDALTMILRTACHQAHIRAGLLGSTAEASGDAYEQARAPFVSDVKGVGEAVDGPLAAGLAWLTVAADWLAGSNTPTFLDDWTVQVQSHPNAGAPSTQFQAETRANVAAELLSPEEGIARLNVQDVPAEQARIAAARTLSVEKARAEIAALWVGLGADFQTAAKRAGLSDQEAADLARSDGPPFVAQ